MAAMEPRIQYAQTKGPREILRIDTLSHPAYNGRVGELQQGKAAHVKRTS